MQLHLFYLQKENQPFLRGTLNHLLVLIGGLVGAKIDRMPHVLRLGKHIRNRVARPVIGPGHIRFALARPPPLPGEVIGRALYLIHHQDFGNRLRAFALRAQMENAAHNICRFFVYQPVVLFVRVLLEPIGNRVGDRLAGLAPYLILRFLFPAAIAHIPFRHDVDEGRKLPRTLVGTVHAVGDGNKPNSMLPKENFRIEASLQIVSPYPAHILGNHTADLPGLNVRDKLFPAGPLKS